MLHHIDALWGSQLQQTQSPPQTRRVGLLSDSTKNPAGFLDPWWVQPFDSHRCVDGKQGNLQFDLVRSIDIGGILNIHVHAICTYYIPYLCDWSWVYLPLFKTSQSLCVGWHGRIQGGKRSDLRNSSKPQLLDCRDYKNQYIMVGMDINGWLLIIGDDHNSFSRWIPFSSFRQPRLPEWPWQKADILLLGRFTPPWNCVPLYIGYMSYMYSSW